MADARLPRVEGRRDPGFTGRIHHAALRTRIVSPNVSARRQPGFTGRILLDACDELMLERPSLGELSRPGKSRNKRGTKSRR